MMQALPATGFSAALPTAQNTQHSIAFAAHPDSLPQACPIRASLVLDSKGTIVFCNAAAVHLSGMAGEQLIGRPIKSLLPGLPLGPLTEGYNVAFVAFSSAARGLRSWSLVKDDGSRVRIEGRISLLNAGEGYLFCLELHYPGNDGAASNDEFPVSGHS
jgi:PAS domain S-box-containing protein